MKDYYPEESIKYSERGESLKSKIIYNSIKFLGQRSKQ
jgi:hypothetical protein